MTVIVNVPVALKHKILKLHPHATVVVGGHDDTMENLLNTASYNLEPVTDKQTTCKLKIINAFVWIIAPNGRKHVLGGIRERKKTKQKKPVECWGKDKPPRTYFGCSWKSSSRMLLCVWFHASPVFTMNTIIQASLSAGGNLLSILRAAPGIRKPCVYLQSYISAPRPSGVSVLIEIWRAAAKTSAGSVSEQTPAHCPLLLPNCCDFSVTRPQFIRQRWDNHRNHRIWELLGSSTD